MSSRLQSLFDEELAANVARFEDNMRRIDQETHSAEIDALQATVADLETKLRHTEKKLVLVTSENHRLRLKLGSQNAAADMSQVSDTLQTKYRTALRVIDQLQRGVN